MNINQIELLGVRDANDGVIRYRVGEVVGTHTVSKIEKHGNSAKVFFKNDETEKEDIYYDYENVAFKLRYGETEAEDSPNSP